MQQGLVDKKKQKKKHAVPSLQIKMAIQLCHKEHSDEFYTHHL